MLSDLIHHILAWIERFGIAGYFIAFLAAFLETTFGVGWVLPGSTIIILLGALAAGGYLNLTWLLGLAVAGAIAGDNLNYYLGKRYGAKWLGRGFWFIRPAHYEKAQRFMDAHGAKSVFFARFIPSAKEVVPFIAGTLKMNKAKFLFWNVLGGIGWGVEFVLAGYIFGQSFNLARLWLSRAGLFFVLVLLVLLVLYFAKWLIIRKWPEFRVVAGSLQRSLVAAFGQNEHVARWIQSHPRAIAFVQARFDRSAFSGLPLTVSTAALVYVLALLSGIVEDLITSDPIVAADIRIANLFASFRTPALTDVFTWITLLGKAEVVLCFIAVAAALLWLWGKRHFIAPLLLSVAGSWTFTYLGKLAFHRPRPQLALYTEPSFSFPSGHATVAVAFYGFAAYLLVRSVQSWRKRVNLFFAAILLILAIGFSRIYFGVHFVSDVWGGYLVGTIWLIIAVTLAEWRERLPQAATRHPPGSARLISAGLAVGAALFYTGFSLHYRLPETRAAAKTETTVSRPVEIFTSEQKKYTETLLGQRQEPINFIFLAQGDRQLLTALQQAGWSLTDKANIAHFLKAIEALVLAKHYPAAPVSPSFWNMKIQTMSFAQVPGTDRPGHARHLRVWRTHARLTNGETVYVGMADATEGLKWWLVPEISPDLNSVRNRLFQDLFRSGRIETFRKFELVKPQVGRNLLGDPFFTDGGAYVVSLK